MLVQGSDVGLPHRVAKEVDLDQVVAAAVGATQEAIYFFGYKGSSGVWGVSRSNLAADRRRRKDDPRPD